MPFTRWSVHRTIRRYEFGISVRLPLARQNNRHPSGARYRYSKSYKRKIVSMGDLDLMPPQIVKELTPLEAHEVHERPNRNAIAPYPGT